ncbi:hypothetical protein OG912_15205 [Streptomyces sp. NBC_00464]
MRGPPAEHLRHQRPAVDQHADLDRVGIDRIAHDDLDPKNLKNPKNP